MFCKTCKSDKHEDEMHNGIRCTPCQRESWKEKSREQRKNGKIRYNRSTGHNYHLVPKEVYQTMVLNTQYLIRRFA